MKPTTEKKLRLGKRTILDFNTVLEREVQKMVKGGTSSGVKGTTDVPVYC